MSTIAGNVYNTVKGIVTGTGGLPIGSAASGTPAQRKVQQQIAAGTSIGATASSLNHGWMQIAANVFLGILAIVIIATAFKGGRSTIVNVGGSISKTAAGHRARAAKAAEKSSKLAEAAKVAEIA